jgi:glycerol kinase
VAYAAESSTITRPKAILALDQGTTSSRAIVFASDGSILGSAQETLAQHYPEPGWVEHDPEDIWATQLRSCRAALEQAEVKAGELAAIGIANQRETALLWDAKTGAALGNAIVWQCRRTADRCAELRQAGFEPTVRSLTGLRIDPYFSATKIEWLLANREGADWLLAQGRLRAGTIDSFLIWRLSGGRYHVTDVGNASRTMLFDIHALKWADDLLNLFVISPEILPRVCPSSSVIGVTDPAWLGAAIPISGVAGDQQAALFAQAALQPGDCKNTYGTGCFLLMNVGTHPAIPDQGLLSTVAWSVRPAPRQASDVGRAQEVVRTEAEESSAAAHGGLGAVTYALEGSVFMAGGAVQWLRDALGIIDSSDQVGPLAAQAPDNGGVYFVPALTGLGTPYWDPYARGLLIGLTRGTRPEHLARATEEAICFQTREVLEAMRTISGARVASLRVDGGAAGDDTLLQLQADILGLPVTRPRIRETTALGAAALAGLAVGFWAEDDIARLAGTERVFQTNMPAEERQRLYRRWQQAADKALGWARET